TSSPPPTSRAPGRQSPSRSCRPVRARPAGSAACAGADAGDRRRGAPRIGPMEGSTEQRTERSWLRCYRCWSQNLEVQVHYEGTDGEERIVIHLLVELYARSIEEATEVLEDASRGALALTSLAEESRPPAATGEDLH